MSSSSTSPTSSIIEHDQQHTISNPLFNNDGIESNQYYKNIYHIKYPRHYGFTEKLAQEERASAATLAERSIIEESKHYHEDFNVNNNNVSWWYGDDANADAGADAETNLYEIENHNYNDIYESDNESADDDADDDADNDNHDIDVYSPFSNFSPYSSPIAAAVAQPLVSKFHNQHDDMIKKQKKSMTSTTTTQHSLKTRSPSARIKEKMKSSRTGCYNKHITTWKNYEDHSRKNDRSERNNRDYIMNSYCATSATIVAVATTNATATATSTTTTNTVSSVAPPKTSTKTTSFVTKNKLDQFITTINANNSNKTRKKARTKAENKKREECLLKLNNNNNCPSNNITTAATTSNSTSTATAAAFTATSTPITATTTTCSNRMSLNDEKRWNMIRNDVLAAFGISDDNTNANNIITATPTTQKERLLIEQQFNNDLQCHKILKLRGITQRPSNKFQAQIYHKGKSRYIGVFDTEKEAAIAYEMVRSKIKK